MFLLINYGIDAVIIFMLFAIMSKLEEINRRLTPRVAPKAPGQIAPPQ